MSSRKVYFCDLCLIMAIAIIVSAEDVAKSTTPIVEVPKGNCTCGGFASCTPEAGNMPLLSQMPGLIVKCNEEGQTTCMTLCTALATATKAKGPEVLCKRLNNADNLKLSAFYKICDQPWIYANMTAEDPLCCKDNKAIECSVIEKKN